MTDSRLDAKWLRLQIARAGYSLRQFAGKMNLDPATFQRMLQGKRRVQPVEAEKIAQLLALDITEVSERVLGLKLGSASAGSVGVAPSARVSVAAAEGKAPIGGRVIAPSGEVRLLPTAESASSAIVGLALEGDPFLDGWRVLCAPGDVSATLAEGVSSGIVQTRDGRLLLRKIRAGFSPGVFDLGPLFGFGDQENGVSVVGVIPVVGLER